MDRVLRRVQLKKKMSRDDSDWSMSGVSLVISGVSSSPSGRTGLRGAGGGAYVVLGELDLDGLGVPPGLPLLPQELVRVGHPGQQLVQRVLELTQGQQPPLQLVLQHIEAETQVE